VQFGTLANYLDIRPRHSLVDALDAVGELDRVALEGYMEKYSEKLHLLSAAGERVVLPENLPVPSLDALFDLISGQYDQVVVDAPRILNHFTATAIERADSILLVMQQSVAGLEETLRLAGILRSELGVAPDRIRVVVNRYQKNMAVDAAHIKTAIGELDTVIVPNDFRQVMQSVDSGIPIYRHARGSSVTKSLLKLQHSLSGQPPAERRGLLGRSIAQLLGA
jgi:pilus assembly protein CpaE